MPYVPEPNHPVRIVGDADPSLTAQLGREFREIEAADLQIRDTVRGALMWKAYTLILDGVGGTPDGAANATLPDIFDSFNIDLTVNSGAGVLRLSEGVYVFTLLISQLFGIDVLPVMYPQFSQLIPTSNLDATAESTRLAITGIDIPSGTLEISIEQLEVPASGKGTWVPYDLRDGDRIWSMGLLNFKGRAADFIDAPGSS